MCTNWRDFYDPDSGISLYEWGIGIEPGAMDVIGPIAVSRTRHTYCDRVTLQHNVRYYATLIAFHSGSDRLNVTETSNGGRSFKSSDYY